MDNTLYLLIHSAPQNQSLGISSTHTFDVAEAEALLVRESVSGGKTCAPSLILCYCTFFFTLEVCAVQHDSKYTMQSEKCV